MIKKINFLLGILFLWSIPSYAAAIDLDSLESTVSSQLCSGDNCQSDCDDKLAQRVGHDLPADADSCHATEQYRLLKQGLYRTVGGKVQSLQGKFKALAIQKEIDVPRIQQQRVDNKTSPYVIDLNADIESEKVAKSKLSKSNLHDVSSGRSQ